jgi:hypothetical protein
MIEWIVSLLLTFLSPTRLRCPGRMWVEGVRTDGQSVCRDGAADVCPTARPCPDGHTERAIRLRLACPEGTRPSALNDGKTIACVPR